MQILSLTLEDIKSYDRAAIEFTPGTNAIVGQNGAGKSTILEAIGFALFDTLPYKQADFVREGVKTGTVTVRFRSSHDDRPYDVVRKCGGSSLYYAFDPETETRVVEGKADMVRFLRMHLGADVNADLERLFRDAVGVLQGTLTAAFLDVASRRVTTFDPLLQVHDYDTAWTRLREPVRTLRDRVQALDVELAGLRARLEQLPALEEAVAARAAELTAKQTQATQIEQELTEVQATLAIMDAAAQQVNSLTRAADHAAADCARAGERLADAEQALAEAKEAAVLVAAHQAGFDAYAAAQAEKRALDAQVGTRAQWQQQRATLETTLARLQAEMAGVEQAQGDVSAAKADVAALTAPAAQQEELMRALTAARAQVAQRDAVAQEATRTEQELARLTKRRQELATAREAAARLDQEQQAAQESITALQATIEDKVGVQQTLKAQADAVTKQNAELKETDQGTCPVCEQPLTPAHRTAMLERNESRLATMRADYRAARDEVDAARAKLKEAQAALTKLSEQQRRLPRAQEIDEVDASIQAQETTLVTLRTRLDA
ncbi:MAG: AAA family ATPase, partial [Caldilineaceae bacterium]|nr:AAA family ATPase [Caldilineaceae bacterium]